ncbi:MAG: S8 family serine peptidase [Candidatus Eisenbacteria bacterium]|nr:S8 family serine peptidase [Candidatus Eisenbacteria bacterium]
MAKRARHSFRGPVAGLGLLLTQMTAASAVESPYVPGQIVVRLAPEASAQEFIAIWGLSLTAQAEDGSLLCSSSTEDIPGLANQMRQDAAVVHVEPNYRAESPEAVRQMILAAVGGTLAEFEDQGASNRIGLGAAHAVTRGAGVVVAVLDTGVDPGHEVWGDRISPLAYDFVDNDTSPWEHADGLDQDGDGEFDEGYGHGSMVAGIIALVAPEATLLPLRVLDTEGRSDVFTIARAIRYAVDTGAAVVNMSFGVPGALVTLKSEIERGDALGVVFVGAAGNEDRPAPTYTPADLASVIMVTALDEADTKAEFADYHTKVAIAAPGVGVRSAYPGHEWGLGSGCSFATGFVTGEVALLRSLHPDWNRSTIESRITGSATPVDDLPGNQGYAGRLGEGRIDVGGAITTASDAPSAAPVFAPGIAAYPNPGAGQIRFRLGPGLAASTLQIFDPQGRRVAVLRGKDGQFAWDPHPALPAGSYFARIPGGPSLRVERVR